MSWLDFFQNKTTQLQHSFGRGTNANLSPDEEELFNKSYAAFEKKDILNAYEFFFESLENFTNDVANQNISTTRSEGKLNFSIFQGTAEITGYITQEHLYAEAIVCKLSSTNVALKRYILDRNYQLTYAYYFIDDNHIKIKIYHDNITMTPQKIYFPLREIALNVDFDKEYIKNEFDSVVLEDTSHLQKIDKDELIIKHAFLQSTSEDVLEKINTLPTNDNSGMQAFLLLNIFYMIDYLLVPHFSMYQKMSKKVQDYFVDETTTIEAKNNDLRNYITKLQDMNLPTFSQNFYNAKYTFNPIEKTPKEDVDNFISESLLKIRWYKNNRYPLIIPTIYKYIVFYILYNYGLNPVIKSLLHTLVEIQNQQYFLDLGYTELYNESLNTFSKKVIVSRIEDIVEPHQTRFKSLEPFGEELNFSSLNEFSNSFYIQIQNLDFEEI